MTLSLTFSQSFFEHNFSVQLKLLRFSAIFLLRNKARNAGRSGKNAGIKPKCGISRTIAGRLTRMHSSNLLTMLLGLALKNAVLKRSTENATVFTIFTVFTSFVSFVPQHLQLLPEPGGHLRLVLIQLSCPPLRL